MGISLPLRRDKAALDASHAQRLKSWRALSSPAVELRLDQARCVVVDVETAGLNPNRDALIAIGAMAVQGARICLDDSFEVILRQDNISHKDNVLVHGIGAAAQAGGVMPAEALLCFLEFLSNAPLVAFHVSFDAAALRRALQKFLALNFKYDWLDLAYVLPALFPDRAGEQRTLDDWMQCFGIRNPARHAALADAWATAELLLIVFNQARRTGIDHLSGLRALEKAQRWVNWAR